MPDNRQDTNVASDTLPAALERHDVMLPAEQVEWLDRYCGLLWEWNEKLNLTRHLDYETFVARDVIDSLAFAKFLEPRERVLDVGTGGGVPGVVLGIVRPDLSVTLAESIGKKAKAVSDIVHQLRLPISVHQGRAEALLAAGQQFDTLVIRAVARLEKLLLWFNPYWSFFHRMLVLKGPAWVEERQAARERQLIQHLDLRRLASYPMAGSDAESVLLQLTPKREAKGKRQEARAPSLARQASMRRKQQAKGKGQLASAKTGPPGRAQQRTNDKRQRTKKQRRG